MSEQTDRARAAEERAKRQQRDVFRNVLRDPEARAELLRDPEFASIVAAAVDAQFNEILRQAREERMAQAIERQAQARAKAPGQVSVNTNGSSPFADDLEHTPEFMRAIHAGLSYPHARTVAAEAHPELTRRPGWRPGAAAGVSRADSFAYPTTHPDELWPTRSGSLRTGRSDHQQPRQVVTEYAPDTTAAVLPPGHDSAVLNRGI